MCSAAVSFVCSNNSALSVFGLLTSEGWRCLLLQCQCASVRLHIKHALTQTQSCKRKNRGRRRGSGKLLRRQILPLFDTLMLIHSERTSCLPAYTVPVLPFFLCLGLSFPLSRPTVDSSQIWPLSFLQTSTYLHFTSE